MWWSLPQMADHKLDGPPDGAFQRQALGGGASPSFPLASFTNRRPRSSPPKETKAASSRNPT